MMSGNSFGLSTTQPFQGVTLFHCGAAGLNLDDVNFQLCFETRLWASWRFSPVLNFTSSLKLNIFLGVTKLMIFHCNSYFGGKFAWVIIWWKANIVGGRPPLCQMSLRGICFSSAKLFSTYHPTDGREEINHPLSRWEKKIGKNNF